MSENAELLWKERPLSERLSFIGRAVIENDTTTKIHKHLRRAMNFARTGHQGGIHIMTGETNTGKTAGQRLFMHYYAQDHNGELKSVVGLEPTSSVAAVEYVELRSSEGKKHPIVRIEIAKNPTFKSLMSDIVFSLTGRRPTVLQSFADLMSTLHQQLYGQGIKVLIFDDAQHTTESTSTRVKYEAAEIFKILAKVLNAEIVLAGLPVGTREVVEKNKQLDPLELNAVEVVAYSFPYDEDAPFVAFLQALSAYLPFDEPSILHELELAQRIFEHSHGVVGYVKSLLRTATEYAIDEGYPFIDQHVLAEALREVRNAPDNAFTGPPPAPPPRDM